MFAKFKHLTWKASLLTTLISLLAFTIALAASGDLDTTFDGDGLVTTNIVPSNPGRADYAQGIAIQTDGKIVAAGPSGSDFAVTRYNTNGSLDTTFHLDGRLITNFGGDEQAQDVAVQSNGKIVVSGQVCGAPTTIGGCDVALARYKPGGALDITFSGDGKVVTDFGGGDNGSYGGLAIQSNGKIVMAGYIWNGLNYDFAIYRYLSNGSLDTTFSRDGKAKIDFGFGGGGWDSAFDLVIQSDGKIVVVGYIGGEPGGPPSLDFAIARLNKNGTLDTSFSGDGKQITSVGGNAIAYSVTLQMDGKIVVVGVNFSEFADPVYVVVVRYNPDGSLDTTFNGTGINVFSVILGADSAAEDVVVQSDGKIVVLGRANAGNGYVPALMRLNGGGSFDTAFSGDGKVIFDFGNPKLSFSALALQADGKYVLGGSAYDGTQEADFALARVLP